MKSANSNLTHGHCQPAAQTSHLAVTFEPESHFAPRLAGGRGGNSPSKKRRYHWPQRALWLFLALVFGLAANSFAGSSYGSDSKGRYFAAAHNGCGIFLLHAQKSFSYGNVSASAGPNNCVFGYSGASSSNGPGGGSATSKRKGGGWAGSPGTTNAPETSFSTNSFSSTATFDKTNRTVTLEVSDALLAATSDGAVSQFNIILWQQAFDADDQPTPLKTLWTGGVILSQGNAVVTGALAGQPGLDFHAEPVQLDGGQGAVVENSNWTLTIPVPASVDMDTIAVTVQVDGGQDEVTAPIYATFESVPVSQSVGLGNDATFTAVGSGDAPIGYQWLQGSSVVGSGPSVTFSNVNNFSEFTNLVCVVTNNFSSVTSPPVSLVITDKNFFISCPPAVTNVTCSSNAVVTYPSPLVFSGTLISCTPPSGSIFPLGTSVVTCVAVDYSGSLTSSCSFTVTLIHDTLPPVINCSSNKTVQCGQAWSFTTPTATDNLCSNVSLFAVSTVTNGSCPKVVTRIWRAIDCCGNSSTCTQTVTIVDTTPPVFLTACTTNIYFAGGSNNFTATVAASPSPGLLTYLQKAGVTHFKGFDECSVNSYFAHTFTKLPSCITSAKLVVRLKPCGDICGNDTIGLGGIGSGGVVTTNGSWSRFLGAGNSAPGLLPNNWCTYISGQTIILDLAALPLAGGGTTNLIPALNANGFLDLTCQDDSGVDYAQLTVVSCCGKTSKTVECGSKWTFDAPTAIDNCCTNVTVTVLGTTSTGGCPKVMTRYWQAIDCCGNTAVTSEAVTLIDTTPPVITHPSNIIRYTCDNSMRVYYTVTAWDACSGVVAVTCTPPSGSIFSAGVSTLVHCTATDACGNSTNVTFAVTVINNSHTVSQLLGIVDCFKAPFEAAIKSPQLAALYPPARWKNFDDTAVNHLFGCSFMGLPANITAATLQIQMKPNATDIPKNDTISIGLKTNSAFAWGSYIGNFGTPSLLSTPWSAQSGCGVLFTMNVAAMPGTGANLLPLINSQNKLDIFVQDDTAVDFARLTYTYCPQVLPWGGWGWTVTNAVLADSGNYVSISPVQMLGYQTNFTATIAPGATHGIKVGINSPNLGSGAGSALTIASQNALWPDASPSLTLVGDGNGNVSLGATAGSSNVTQVVVSYRLNGAIVRQITQNAQAIIIMEDGPMDSVQAKDNTLTLAFNGARNFRDCLTCPATAADQITFTFVAPAGAPDSMLSALTLSASGVDELQVTDTSTMTGDAWVSVTGDASANASGDQLSVSANDSSSTNSIGFTVHCESNPRSEIALGVDVVQNLNGTSENNGVIRAVITGTVGPDTMDAMQLTFTQSGGGWNLASDFSVLGSIVEQYRIYNHGAPVTSLTFHGTPHVPVLPLNLPGMYVSTNGQVLMFNWTESQVIMLNGANYVGDELRVEPFAPDLTMSAITSVHVEATGVDSLTLNSAVTAPINWWLLPLIADPDQLLIQWTGPANGVVESASSAKGPWSLVPDQNSYSATLPPAQGTNSPPVQLFRVRSN